MRFSIEDMAKVVKFCELMSIEQGMRPVNVFLSIV